MHKQLATQKASRRPRHYKKSVRFGRHSRAYRVLTVAVLMVVAFMVIALPAVATQTGVLRFVKVTGYDPDVDYSALMNKALDDGSPFALEMGRIYEQQRNMKIRDLGLDYPESDFFSTYNTVEEIRKAQKRAWAAIPYTDEDLELLAHVIYGEAGCYWIPDWVQIEVGSVVLNRLKDPGYPNTLYEVIYQPNQYECTWDGNFNKTPDARTYANAEWLLQNGSQSPPGVIGQSGFISGPIYKVYYDEILGPEYFCYRANAGY